VLLDYLGLALLVGYIGKGLLQAVSVAIAAVKLAWGSVDNPATEQQVVDHAADRLAFAIGLVFRGILQGVVAFLLDRAGLSKCDLYSANLASGEFNRSGFKRGRFR
jgi:hypothetical protein